MEPEESFNDILRALEKAISEADNPQNENYVNRKKTIYDYVADLAGLEHTLGNRYRSINGHKPFIRTKFGFQPEEIFNKGLQLSQLRIQYDQTLTDLDELRNKYQCNEDDFNKTKTELLNLQADTRNLKALLAAARQSNQELNRRLDSCNEELNALITSKKDLSNQLKEATHNNNILSIYKTVIDDMKNEPNRMGKYYNRIIAELVATNKQLSKEIATLTKKEI